MADKQTGLIIAVGGGKGGVGKSVLAIALATAFARDGRSVILADLDLGAANLHTYLGIRGRTPTIADFILNRAPSLEGLVVETGEKNLGLISGAGFVPGATNPAHWVKLKLLRRLKALPADYIVIDLGAGVHFNTLDFFGAAGRGVVITAPEPGAVMNAYGFIKGALFRRMQTVFRHEPEVAKLIEAETRAGGDEHRFSVEWFRETLGRAAPGLLPLVDEIGRSFSPALVINQAPGGRTHLLVKNLLALCAEKLGVALTHIGDLPEVRTLSNHLLNVPRFFTLPEGEPYFSAARGIAERLAGAGAAGPGAETDGFAYSDEEQAELLRLIDTLDDRVFSEATRRAWKLRVFFKPADVVGFLVSRGVSHELFYQSRRGAG